MLRKSRSQRDLVNGDGVGDMALANDAATGSAQGEMNLPSLLRLCVADLPSLVSGKDQIQPRVFHYKQHLCRTAQGTPLTTLLTSLPLLRSSRHVALVVRCVALVAKGSFGTCVAFVAKDSFATCVAFVPKDPFATCSRGVAAKHFPFRTSTRCTSPEAISAEFCPTGSSIIPAMWLAAFITSLGICFHHGSDGRA